MSTFSRRLPATHAHPKSLPIAQKNPACSQYGGTLTIVQRDVDVSVPGDSGYVRKTC